MTLIQTSAGSRPATANGPGLESLRPHKSRLERDKENAAAAATASGTGAVKSKAKYDPEAAYVHEMYGTSM